MKQSARLHSFGRGGAAGVTYFIFPLTPRIVLAHLSVRLVIVTGQLNLTTRLPRSMRVRSRIHEAASPRTCMRRYGIAEKNMSDTMCLQ